MPDAFLKFDGRDFPLERDVTAIGRISENDVSFPADSNVSRYHAEIERRGGDYWLIDLKSSNGTTVNGERLTGEVRLNPGDKLVFGGSSEAIFLDATARDADFDGGGGSLDAPGLSMAKAELGTMGSQIESEAEYAAVRGIQHGVRNAVSGSATAGEAASGASAASDAASVSVPVETAAAASSGGSTVIIAGAVVGLAVVCAVAAGAFYMTRGSACTAQAKIVKPESGDSLNAPVEIELDTQDAGCVQQAVFTIDGQVVATADAPAFAATIDPKDLPEYSDGTDHALQVVLIDTAGTQMPQAGLTMIAFDTRVVTKASPTPGPANTNSQPPKQTGRGQPSLVQINDMSQKLVKQLSGTQSYNVSNKQFLEEIQKRTGEYAQDGYSQRATAFREPITVAFVREQNLDPPLGFILAMSRSKFVPAKQGDREGLWQLPTALIAENKYNGQCPTESLSDPLQNCASKSAALYLKALIFSVFDGDPVYAAAAFGKSPGDAATWKATLPPNRSGLDVWNTIKTADEREQLLRFFAAGIVAENPQAFGLAKDRPLSELYRVAMQ